MAADGAALLAAAVSAAIRAKAPRRTVAATAAAVVSVLTLAAARAGAAHTPRAPAGTKRSAPPPPDGASTEELLEALQAARRAQRQRKRARKRERRRTARDSGPAAPVDILQTAQTGAAEVGASAELDAARAEPAALPLSRPPRPPQPAAELDPDPPLQLTAETLRRHHGSQNLPDRAGSGMSVSSASGSGITSRTVDRTPGAVDEHLRTICPEAASGSRPRRRRKTGKVRDI